MPATPVNDVGENATMVVATVGSTSFSPLQAMYPSNKTAGAARNALMMDFVTSPAVMKLSRQSIESHYTPSRQGVKQKRFLMDYAIHTQFSAPAPYLRCPVREVKNCHQAKKSRAYPALAIFLMISWCR